MLDISIPPSYHQKDGYGHMYLMSLFAWETILLILADILDIERFSRAHRRK